MKNIPLNILFGLGIACQFSACAQTKQCIHSIEIDECSRDHFFSKAPDEVSLAISGNKVAKITLNDCRGSMHFKLYDGKTLLVDGNYLNATDTTTVSVISSNIVTGLDETKTEKIFKPRRDGSWFYYDQKGKLEREDIYSNGKLLESKKQK